MRDLQADAQAGDLQAGAALAPDAGPAATGHVEPNPAGRSIDRASTHPDHGQRGSAAVETAVGMTPLDA